MVFILLSKLIYAPQISIYFQVYFGPDIPNMFISEKDGAGDSQRLVYCLIDSLY